MRPYHVAAWLRRGLIWAGRWGGSRCWTPARSWPSSSRASGCAAPPARAAAGGAGRVTRTRLVWGEGVCGGVLLVTEGRARGGGGGPGRRGRRRRRRARSGWRWRCAGVWGGGMVSKKRGTACVCSRGDARGRAPFAPNKTRLSGPHSLESDKTRTRQPYHTPPAAARTSPPAAACHLHVRQQSRGAGPGCRLSRVFVRGGGWTQAGGAAARAGRRAGGGVPT